MPLTAKRPTQELIDIVGALGGTWSGYIAMCRCPAHSDSDPRLSIRQGDRGILVTCFAGCSREDDQVATIRHPRRPIRNARPMSSGSGSRLAMFEAPWPSAISLAATSFRRHARCAFIRGARTCRSRRRYSSRPC